MVAPTRFGTTLPSSGSVILLGILIFKGLTVRRLYKSFDFKWLIQSVTVNVCNADCRMSEVRKCSLVLVHKGILRPSDILHNPSLTRRLFYGSN
jgi:hypothetical protein